MQHALQLQGLQEAVQDLQQKVQELQGQEQWQVEVEDELTALANSIEDLRGMMRSEKRGDGAGAATDKASPRSQGPPPTPVQSAPGAPTTPAVAPQFKLDPALGGVAAALASK